MNKKFDIERYERFLLILIKKRRKEKITGNFEFSDKNKE